MQLQGSCVSKILSCWKLPPPTELHLKILKQTQKIKILILKKIKESYWNKEIYPSTNTSLLVEAAHRISVVVPDSLGMDVTNIWKQPSALLMFPRLERTGFVLRTA